MAGTHPRGSDKPLHPDCLARTPGRRQPGKRKRGQGLHLGVGAFGVFGAFRAFPIYPFFFVCITMR